MKKPLKILFGSALLASSALVLSAAIPVQAQNTQGGNICLNVTEIRSSQAVDNRTIVYRMKDGKVWRNTLAAPCPELMSFSTGACFDISVPGLGTDAIDLFAASKNIPNAFSA